MRAVVWQESRKEVRVEEEEAGRVEKSQSREGGRTVGQNPTQTWVPIPFPLPSHAQTLSPFPALVSIL